MRPEASEIHGWGGTGTTAHEYLSADLEHPAAEVVLARGLGRSYGDASLPPSAHPFALNTTRADRVLAFDPGAGVIRAEAGLSLEALNDLIMPHGLFPRVTPGTKFVTLGGMVAADVHGKNQHEAGNISHQVRSMRVLVADGRVVTCSRTEHPDLFFATLGGMGLTGIVLDVEMTLERIPSPYIFQESRRIRDIDEFEEALVEVAPKWPFTVGWLDCLATGKNLGRGILGYGRWATPDEAPKRAPKAPGKASIPFDFPEAALNRYSIGAFNELLYQAHYTSRRQKIVSADEFWYPLDSLHDWNRMYGRRGFTQYQCVLPRSAKGGARRLLESLTKSGATIFLCVFKDFGKESEGTLSFPMPGVTLAIDIPVRDDTQRLVDQTNELVLREGGRIYLAKDAFTRGEHYRAMDPRVPRFEAVRDTWDPNRRWKSALGTRIFGDAP